MTTPVEEARRVADTVLYEGYVLYPYRAGAGTNQVRWQWGVLMPHDVVAFDASERAGDKVLVDRDYVEKQLEEIVKDNDLSKFIL